jgi:hypothetical protein
MVRAGREKMSFKGIVVKEMYYRTLLGGQFAFCVCVVWGLNSGPIP